MSLSITDLPDDILVEFFSNYVSPADLNRLGQVCRRFRTILLCYPSPWRKALERKTNVSFSYLKNTAGCPVLENCRHEPSIASPSMELPDSYRYAVVYDRSNETGPLLAEDYRRPYDQYNRCSTRDCDIHRLTDDYRTLTRLASRWKQKNQYQHSTLIKFRHRAQTSLLQYDEHLHRLWFTYNHRLQRLNLDQNSMETFCEFSNDDVLCYKVFNDDFVAIANGNCLRLVSGSTRAVYTCPNQFVRQTFPGERHDILSLDGFTNDLDRYVVANGSRDFTLTLRTFDISTQHHQTVWCACVEDRVLCTRFTPDGHHILIGTGGTSNVYPVALFNIERPHPIHLYNGAYRVGAGVRCIEWASPNVFVAAGFDNQFKEFDLRTGKCHFTFHDNFGNDYCSLAVSVDPAGASNGIVLGSNHHSTVRLVDRRQRRTANIFFVAQEPSPVHSLAVTPEYLFASVDKSIVALDFNGDPRQKFRRISHLLQ